MKTAVFICGYPRSGTTWVSAFLPELCAGGARSLKALCLDMDAPTQGDTFRNAEERYGEYDVVFLKTHMSPECLESEYLGLVHDWKVVYVYRNPIPLALSTLRYVLRESGLPTDLNLVGRNANTRQLEFLEQFIKYSGYRGFESSLRTGSWIDNFIAGRELYQRETDRVRMVRYESIVNYPIQCGYYCRKFINPSDMHLADIGAVLSKYSKQNFKEKIGNFFVAPESADLEYYSDLLPRDTLLRLYDRFSFVL